MANNTDQATTFSKTNTRFYVPVITLSTQDNAKQLEQVRSSFKRTINWNKYQSKNQYYNVMINGQNFFDQSVRNYLITYDGIQKLQQVKGITTQLVVCWIIIISKTILR